MAIALCGVMGSARPINVNVAQLLRVGDQLVQVGGGARYWVESPEGAPPGWGFASR